MQNGQVQNGIYTIRPDEQGSVQVLCDQTTDGGGWDVFQRRVSPHATSFNQTWEKYRMGFGDLGGEFWLGNDNVHRLTVKNATLRIDFHYEGRQLYAKYENFSVGTAQDGYRWWMDSYSGILANAIYGASVAEHRQRGMKFTTPDADNDRNPNGNCADERGSGWWYNWCGLENLNHKSGPIWVQRFDALGQNYSYVRANTSEMKVRQYNE